MAKKIMNLKTIEEFSPPKISTIFDRKEKLYYSGFCLTDNLHFAEFYLPKLPSECRKPVEIFTFEEDKLVYQIGDQPRISFSDEKIVKFNDFFVDKCFVMYFTNKYPQGKFYWLKSFLKEPIIGLIGVLIGTKLVGMLKLKSERKES